MNIGAKITFSDDITTTIVNRVVDWGRKHTEIQCICSDKIFCEDINNNSETCVIM